MDFVDPAMVEEGSKIQAENDAVWNDFNKAQYEPVMERPAHSSSINNRGKAKFNLFTNKYSGISRKTALLTENTCAVDILSRLCRLRWGNVVRKGTTLLRAS